MEPPEQIEVEVATTVTAGTTGAGALSTVAAAAEEVQPAALRTEML